MTSLRDLEAQFDTDSESIPGIIGAPSFYSI